MPLDKYFGGRGAKVMQAMSQKYGDKKGKSVFHATVNRRKDKTIGKRKTK